MGQLGRQLHDVAEAGDEHEGRRHRCQVKRYRFGCLAAKIDVQDRDVASGPVYEFGRGRDARCHTDDTMTGRFQQPFQGVGDGVVVVDDDDPAAIRGSNER